MHPAMSLATTTSTPAKSATPAATLGLDPRSGCDKQNGKQERGDLHDSPQTKSEETCQGGM